MKKFYYGEINYRMERNHPDWEYVKDHRKTLSFADRYQFDLDYFYSDDPAEMESYIRNDLLLVAGGGYSPDKIKNVKIDIHEIYESDYVDFERKLGL